MDLKMQIERDRENLVDALQQMLMRVEQQRGALQYCDMLLERIAQERNGAAPVGEAAPVEGAID